MGVPYFFMVVAASPESLLVPSTMHLHRFSPVAFVAIPLSLSTCPSLLIYPRKLSCESVELPNILAEVHTVSAASAAAASPCQNTRAPSLKTPR